MRIKIGAQIYTLRNELKSGAAVLPVFQFLKESGCQVVELAAMPCISPNRLSKISKETGVQICSTHAPFERIRDDLDRLADEHLIYDCNIIGIGSMPENYGRKNIDDVNRFADFLTEASRKLADRKMKIMYHNHAFEFKKAGGKRIMDFLIENTPSEVAFSLDVYWAQIGGVSVEEYIDKMGSRLQVMHLKDVKPTALGLWRTMGAPGDGILDFKTYLQKAESNGTPYAVVEVDKTSHPRDAITRGIKFINEIY